MAPPKHSMIELMNPNIIYYAIMVFRLFVYVVSNYGSSWIFWLKSLDQVRWRAFKSFLVSRDWVFAYMLASWVGPMTESRAAPVGQSPSHLWKGGGHLWGTSAHKAPVGKPKRMLTGGVHPHDSREARLALFLRLLCNTWCSGSI